MSDEIKVADATKHTPMSLDDPSEEKQFILISQEDDKVSVPKRIALMSELVKTMADGDKEEHEIPVPNVKTEMLKKVLDYCRYHVDSPAREIEKPLKSTNMVEVVSRWDAEYVNIPQEALFELILAANYMDVKPLLDLCCAQVASMIKGKTTEQIRKTFNIINDFTPEEEAAVIAENKWVEEA